MISTSGIVNTPTEIPKTLTKEAGVPSWVIGEVTRGDRSVRFVDGAGSRG